MILTLTNKIDNNGKNEKDNLNITTLNKELTHLSKVKQPQHIFTQKQDSNIENIDENVNNKNLQPENIIEHNTRSVLELINYVHLVRLGNY